MAKLTKEEKEQFEQVSQKQQELVQKQLVAARLQQRAQKILVALDSRLALDMEVPPLQVQIAANLLAIKIVETNGNAELVFSEIRQAIGRLRKFAAAQAQKVADAGGRLEVPLADGVAPEETAPTAEAADPDPVQT